MSATSVYVAVPIILNVYKNLMYGSEWTPNMPLKFKSFFDLRKSPAYELTYITFAIDMNINTLTCVSNSV
jgi:hypothetical protein